ncbi:MAG TPA: LysE family translocator [Roseiflexaceae bacterium]|nr:LysE family translocator [Roseiflexaceae bacterium]
MLDPQTILVFMAATLTLNITPGPDMLYIVARSMGEGLKAGIISALGIAVGCLIHTFAIAAGLSRLLTRAPYASMVVKLLGACYLIYLGLRALFHRQEPMARVQVERAQLWVIFRQGVVTNVLNPKVALFFLAFLPQFVDARRGSLAMQFVVLGLLFNTSGTLVNTGVALVSSNAGEWWKRQLSGSSASLLQRATGLVLVGLGVHLALF